MNYDYAIITPARNEEKYIEKTIRSVISQTILPVKWIIVNDNSTDKTDELIAEYASRYNFIKHINKKDSTKRDFSAKTYAFQIGYNEIKKTKFDFIVNFDADISFEPDYIQKILLEFEKNPKLGIAGGVICEKVNNIFKQRRFYINPQSVAGAVQMFRRECFEEIGGYIPLKYGGIDTVAEIQARMYGWDVRTFTNIKVFHHRKTGENAGSRLKSAFRLGIQEYSYGSYFVFEILKCIHQIFDKPYFIRSLFRLSGYFFSFCKREEHSVSKEIVSYVRREQIYSIYSKLSDL